MGEGHLRQWGQAHMGAPIKMAQTRGRVRGLRGDTQKAMRSLKSQAKKAESILQEKEGR